MARDLTEGIKLIKSFEGIEDGNPATANLDPYLCPAGYWTIGWGHVVLDSQGNLLRGLPNRLIAQAVYPQGIELAEAETLLRDDVRRFAFGIENALHVQIGDIRFCALLSFAFNVGLGAFRDSTLLKLLNLGQVTEVPKQLIRWIKSKGQELDGLKRRREAEAKLWNSVPAQGGI